MAIAAGTTVSGAQSDRPLGTRSDLSRHTPVLQQVPASVVTTRAPARPTSCWTASTSTTLPRTLRSGRRSFASCVLARCRRPACLARTPPRTSRSPQGSRPRSMRAAVARPQPGAPWLHRLNRTEYANAIRDLLALEIDATSLLPPDDSAAGFDNNRRRARGLAGAARALPVGRGEDQRARRGRRRRSGRPPRPIVVRGDTSQDRRTSKGCRSGRAAACSRATRFRWTAST